VTSEALDVLEPVLRDAGYRTERPEARLGVLGESPSRIVWATAWDGVLEMLEGWEDEQAWLVQFAGNNVSEDKSWELYVVLACGPQPDEHERQALEGIRRDLSYARKLVVPGIDRMSPHRVLDHLAPLQDLRLEVPAPAPDAFALLRARAESESRADVLSILDAHRSNRPLLDAL
jgi:hypothetical protein